MFFKNWRKKKEIKQKVVAENQWVQDRILYDDEKKRIRVLLNAVEKEINAVYTKRIANHEFAIQVGDIAILNKYGETPFGSWAGDANILLYHDKDVENMMHPYTVTITDVFADFSLVHECMYQKFQRLDLIDLRKIDATSIKKTVLDKVFVTAKFNTPTSFKPEWGLPIGAFLKTDSILGEMTAKIWQDEISVSLKERAIKTKIDQIKADKSRIAAMINEIQQIVK